MTVRVVPMKRWCGTVTELGISTERFIPISYRSFISIWRHRLYRARGELHRGEAYRDRGERAESHSRGRIDDDPLLVGKTL